jgi:hypothetical protein
MTTQKPQPDAPQDANGAVWGQMAKTFQSAQESVVKWDSAMQTMRSDQADYNLQSGFMANKEKVMNDPNQNNEEFHISENKKLFEASGAMDTKDASKFKLMAQQQEIWIRGEFKKKKVFTARANVSDIVSLHTANPVIGGRGDTMNYLTSLMQTQVDAGLFNEEEAQTILFDANKKIKKNSFVSDIQTNIAVAEEKLSKNEYGFDVIELSSAKTVFDSEAKKVQMKNQNDLLTRYLGGEDIAVNDVKEMLKSKNIDVGFAESFINKLENPKPDVLSKDQTYIEFQNKVMDIQAKGSKATIQENVKLMSEVMQAHAAGLLDKGDVERILKDRNEIVQEQLGQKAQDVMSKIQPKTLVEKLTFWSDEYAEKKPEIQARMYRRLIDGLSKGEDGEKLLATIIDDEMDVKLKENLAKPERQYATDPDTKERKAYSDDGGITWFDVKTGKEIK